MKNYVYKYLVIYISIFGLYCLQAGYSEYYKIERDFGFYDEVFIYGLVSIFQALLILLLYFIFFSLILKIKLKNIPLYFLVLFSTLLYFLYVDITTNENPFTYFLFYVIVFLLYGIGHKLLQKQTYKSRNF